MRQIFLKGGVRTFCKGFTLRNLLTEAIMAASVARFTAEKKPPNTGPTGMDLTVAFRLYIDQMLADCGEGMKAFLFDKVTLSTVSIVYNQSDLGQKGVYLYELLNVERKQKMRHLNAIVYIRPTQENVTALCRELERPAFCAYYVYFSYYLEDDMSTENALSQIAKADEHEVIKEVKEMYTEYTPVTNNLFTFNLRHVLRPGSCKWVIDALDSTCMGLTSVLLSLKCKPVVRHVKNRPTEELAKAIVKMYQAHPRQFAAASKKRTIPPLLLILDRHNDATTPLLNQWYYHAQAHELLTIEQNKIDVSKMPGLSKDEKAYTFSAENDDFIRENMYKNYGEIGEITQVLMREYQTKVAGSKQLDSIEEMKTFIENFPEFKKLSSTTFKHVGLTSEITRMVKMHHLMAVSEVEQEIVEGDDRSRVKEAMMNLFKNPEIRPYDQVRLGLLYQLRYKDAKDVTDVLVKMNKDSLPFLDAMAKYDSQRVIDPFAKHKAIEKVKKFVRNPFQSKKEKEEPTNIYVRHVPILKQILTEAIQGKLSAETYPTVETYEVRPPPDYKPQDVIVFIVGGATYAEAKVVADVSAAHSCRVILGGTYIHNSRSFLEEVTHEASRPPNLTQCLWDPTLPKGK